MKYKFLFLILFCSFQLLAQNEGNIWYFGNHSGLDFNNVNPIALINGQLNTNEGCASISNTLGQLLFYTDGITVWNKNHQIMDNGNGLLGHESTSQSATILQKPGSDNVFYIFTIDAEFGINGFCYSEVDISLNSGLGAVINKNIFINYSICEKIAIFKHSNGFDYWVVTHGPNNKFYSNLISSSGISNIPIVSNIGISIPFYGVFAQGIMKASPNGTKLAVSSVSSHIVELFNFNPSNGTIYNRQIVLQGNDSWDNFYGIEFSPDSNLLYVSNASSPFIKQFDLTASNIESSQIQLYTLSYNDIGALQLGPDDKIYVANYGESNLGVIKNPNLIGDGCDYQSNSIDLYGKISQLGLPTTYIINPLSISFTSQNLCLGEMLEFTINTSLSISSLSWDFGDGYTSTQLNPTHIYISSGTFTVTLTVNTLAGTMTKIKTIITNFVATSLPTLISPQTFCIQQNTTLNNIIITGQNIKWYDALTGGNLLPNTTLLQNNTTYYVSQTIGICESDRVPVLINIQNTPPPTGNALQTFCATFNPTLNNLVVSATNPIWYDSATAGNILPVSSPLTNGVTYYASQTLNGCESPIRLAVTVSLITTLPANDYTESLCDNLNDGLEIVNLGNYNSNLITPPANYSFSYYTSLSGAQNESVSDKITNFTAYPLSIGDNKVFVRITNTTSCYKVVELKLTLFVSPVITMQDAYPLCVGKNILVDAGSGFNSYSWSTGAHTQNILINQPGNYWVDVTENHGPPFLACPTRKNFNVFLSNPATITNIETQDWTNNENMITVYATGLGNYEYSLDNVHYQDSNIFYGLNSGSHTVYVHDKNDCGVSHDEVFLLMYPNFFTPNGDGFNDTWKIKFSYSEPGMKIKIIDRFGKLIRQLNHNTSWDGTYNGIELPSTDYWFVVTRANGKEHRGHFTLKR
jgi:gliding motility-associated-like protein